LDYLWSPWRYQYVTGIKPGTKPKPACIFCDIASSAQDEENYVLYRGQYNFALLNRYPYSSGHLMIVPFEHVAGLVEASEQTSAEMMKLARRAEESLREAYRPDGLNLGMNLGASAGAGVAGHIHMHVLPRWAGDVNFMTAIAETRVLPEALETSYGKLKELCSRW
jgi:ATP adenylyltransferase